MITPISRKPSPKEDLPNNRRSRGRAGCLFHAIGAGKDQLHLTGIATDPHANPASVCQEIYRQLAQSLSEHRMEIVHERVFGSLGFHPTFLDVRRRVLGDTGQPITYVQGRPCWGEGFAGIQVQAVRPAQPVGGVWTIQDHGIPCGRAWKRNEATFLLLQNLHGIGRRAGAKENRARQAGRMLKRANELLVAQGATYHDVARTWIYLDGILDWYDEFNRVRNLKYAQFGLLSAPASHEGGRPLPPPASTGIEGANPLGAHCVMDLLAVTGPPGVRPAITRMSNTKQKDAFCYGAAFSRGVCIQESDVTQIQISGTAAIDEEGKSLFPGDITAQINRTLDNIEALMAQVDGGLNDISGATVFLKRIEDVPRYRQVAARRGLTHLPAVVVLADVCRAELLFELDAMAVIPH